MVNYKIAFFDVDGTLVNPNRYHEGLDQAIPSSTKLAIQKLKENGIIPVIATGRWMNAILEIGKHLDVDSFITSNGQAIYHDSMLLQESYIPDHQVLKVYNKIIEDNLDGFFDTSEGIYVLPNSTIEFHKGIEYFTLEEGQVPENVLQLLIRSNDIQSVSSWLTDMKVIQTTSHTLDIYPHNVSKASGIQLLLDKLNISKDEAIAFGDADNDIEMLQTVGLGVAMENGTENAKKHADLITDAVWDDGIYNACVKLGLI